MDFRVTVDRNPSIMQRQFPLIVLLHFMVHINNDRDT